jgi:hypothetical protein
MNSSIEDIFGDTYIKILNNLQSVYTNIASALNVVKIVMEQKGFKGSGIKATVNVAPRKVALIM